MSRFTVPGAQVESFTVTNADGQRYALTVTGNLTVSRSQKKRKPLDDAHTSLPKYMLEHKVGTVTFALATDQLLGFIDTIEDAQATVRLLNGRILNFVGLTFASEDGLDENTTEGKTNELTFAFVTLNDGGA